MNSLTPPARDVILMRKKKLDNKFRAHLVFNTVFQIVINLITVVSLIFYIKHNAFSPVMVLNICAVGSVLAITHYYNTRISKALLGYCLQDLYSEVNKLKPVDSAKYRDLYRYSRGDKPIHDYLVDVAQQGRSLCCFEYQDLVKNCALHSHD